MLYIHIWSGGLQMIKNRWHLSFRAAHNFYRSIHLPENFIFMYSWIVFHCVSMNCIFTISYLSDIRVVSASWLLLMWTWLSKCLWNRMLSPLGICQRAWSRGWFISDFWGFSRVAAPMRTPTTSERRFLCLCKLSASLVGFVDLSWDDISKLS